MALVDSANGNMVVTYTYDAWGNVLNVDGSLKTSLGVLNPFRYRGYVYDSETKLYYLQSRYYNPEIGRFISADALVSTGQGILGNNMFAYCNNNPVLYIDETGMVSYMYFSEDNRPNEQPWRDFSLGGSRTFRNNVMPSTAQFIFTKTSITLRESNTGEINIRIVFNTEQTKAHIFMSSEELNEYVRLLNKEIMSRTGTGLDDNNIKQLYGETKLHIFGWGTRYYHFWDERFRETEIDIVNGQVRDPRWYVNFASWLFRGGYIE